MFLSGPISLLPFEKSDTQAAGSIRAILEASGKPVGATTYCLRDRHSIDSSQW